MENPITTMRGTLRRSDFARALSLPLSTLSHIEAGNISLPRKFLAALSALGYDAETVRQQYELFRQHRAQEALARLQEKVRAQQ